MKSIRRSFMYVFAIVCGLTLCGNAVLAASMLEGNLVLKGSVEVNTNLENRKVTGADGVVTKSTINSQDGGATLVFKAETDKMAGLYVAGAGSVKAKQDEKCHWRIPLRIGWSHLENHLGENRR